jgi:hypothetical protein
MQTRTPDPRQTTGTFSTEPPTISPIGNHLHPVGKVSMTKPIPPLEEFTTYFEAGAVRFGVEHRELNEDIINENFGSDPAALAAVQAMHGDDGPPDDEGLSLHVFDSESGTEVLRFDMFSGDPHYHYLPAAPYHIVVPYDPAASGDMMAWALSALSDRLVPLLRNGGHDELAAKIEPSSIAQVLNDVAVHVEKLDAPIVGRNL